MDARTVLQLVRPFTLLAPAVGVVGGAFVANAALARPIGFVRIALGVLAALLVTSASNAWNQLHDVELDRINKPHRPLPAGKATPKQALLLGHVTALAGLGAAWFVGPTFFACVAFGVLATWVYSAPPLRLKRRTVGALVAIAIPRGLLVPVAGWAVVAEPRTAEPWALGLVSGLFVLGAAVTKDFADVVGDEAHGCRTLPSVLGPRRAARLVAPFLAAPFLLYPALGAVGLLRPPVGALALLGVALALLGGAAAASLLADPEGLKTRGGNHPAWAAMYVQLLGAHIGTALVYQLTL